MCEVLDRVEAKGEARGIAKGENKMAALIQNLLALGRNDDMNRCLSDLEFREKLFREFNLG